MLLHVPRAFSVLLVVLLVGSASDRPSRAQAAEPDTLHLDTVVQQALEQNAQARIARRQEDIAENNYALGNAGAWPSLSLNGGYNTTISNTTQQFVNQPEESIDGARSVNTTADATLRWTVFDGLRRFAAYDRLGAEAARQQAATREQVEAVLADVVETYYDVVRQRQQLQVLREGVALSRERLRITETQREVGAAADLAVRQARVDLNADSADVLRQATELTNAKAELNRLRGRPDASTDYAVTTTIEVDTTLSSDALRQTATARSAALRQARQARRAADAERREVRAERFPQLDVTAGYGYAQADSESGFLQQQTSYDLNYGVSLTFDLFDGFNRQRRRQNAQLRAANAEAAVEDVRAQLTTELSSAYETYRSRLDLVALERDNRAAAAANVDLALERFELGTITSVELREVQEQHIQAESRLLTAQFEAKQAEIELLRLSGQLLEAVSDRSGTPDAERSSFQEE